MKKRIHINQHKIRSNKKLVDAGVKDHTKLDPVITCKTYKENIYGHEVHILGESKLVYSPNKPLSCGARVWVETEAPVEILDYQNKNTELMD